MLTYQKNGLLNLAVQLEAKLYEYMETTFLNVDARNIILRNLTSIKKQVKKL